MHDRILILDYGRVRAGDGSSNVKYVDKTYLDDDGFLGKFYWSLVVNKNIKKKY